MDPRTRYFDDTEILETLADDIQARIRTAIPVTLTEDSDGHTVSLQALTMLTRRRPDGSLEKMALPVISDVPINHHGGGGITITHPHKKSDEGIFLIADRALDAWFQNGGQQGAVDARMHSLSDGFYIPGVRSTPRKLQNVSTTSTQMRSDDGKHMVDLHPQKGPTLSADGGKHVVSVNPNSGVSIKTMMKLAVEATQGMALTGNLNVHGNVGASGTIGAPSVLGQTGGIFTGIASGIFGALLVLVALHTLAPSGTPSAAPQAASYVHAAVVER